MSSHDGNSTLTLGASDELATTRTSRIRRAERRRERHNARNQLRVAEQTPIRRLLAGAR
ncbi:hypothetical protein ABT369_39200 [Dactylosporangium sp. NPDC000244]|uniref:hypothetical protein n=1 Tax=Dactylosporangium sp. NPDC000244 TaxID=3154365 RepID=UPI0033262BB9